MIGSLVASFGLIGLAAGLFGLYLARLLVDGSAEDAAETRHNAQIMLSLGTTLLIVGTLWAG